MTRIYDDEVIQDLVRENLTCPCYNSIRDQMPTEFPIWEWDLVDICKFTIKSNITKSINLMI